MRFFFPDSQDLVDPSFDFERERRSVDRLRQRDDLYAHEVFSTPAFDGLLVSKGIVDGFGTVGSRYSVAQRHRLLRVGAPEFFRVTKLGRPVPLMGDCGAFTYVKEKEPPYSVDQLLDFYAECRFDLGISLDHVILDYRPEWDERKSVPAEIRARQDLTLELASQFLRRHRRRKLRFVPLGVAQGWSPKSYARAAAALQRMGYRYLALGGMVPLKTKEILESLSAVADVRQRNVKLHLLGVTRTDHVGRFARFGVASFDSTSPLRQAFKDDHDNYYALDGTFTAIRIPQVEGNPRLQRRIASGEIPQGSARALEGACLSAMAEFDHGRRSVARTLDVLRAYERLYAGEADHADAYRRTLEARPWKQCDCNVCHDLGHHVILFRGAERNRRRGFHNVWVFYRRLRRQLGIEFERAA